MDQFTTIAPPAATSTEKLRWKHFVNGHVQVTYSMGPIVDAYCPSERISDTGMYGTTAALASELLEQLNTSECPLSELGCAIDDLEAYLQVLREVREAFTKINLALMDEKEAA